MSERTGVIPVVTSTVSMSAFVNLVVSPPVSGNASIPQFGWQGPQHAALNQGALGGVTDPAFALYLAKNQKTLQFHDNAQDTLHKGSGHFANLDALDNTPGQGVPTDNGKTAWDMLYAAFSPQRQAWLTQQWQQNPLSENDLPAGLSVYDNVINQFNGVLKALTTAHERHDAQTQALVHQQATQALGALSHYVTDLHMPLHATRFFNWSLAPASSTRPEALTQGIHDFIEGDLFTADELVALAQEARKQPPPKLTMASLKPFLLKQLMQSYLSAFNVFAAQQSVYFSMPNANRQPEQYKAQLKVALKPIVARRFMDAQQSLSAVYNLLWTEAKAAEAIRSQSISATA